ncbi:hypothetical protein IWW38_005453 [Coemansia aciculifera]|uniref:Uncharacterized protein n=1 Tax=Coemansia aciculifera TaxID=417176 RepID=A0ACC1LV71_9FUNG|nr:hypothetical protein IWW38_005453 [Coemansia aciculifera]
MHPESFTDILCNLARITFDYRNTVAGFQEQLFQVIRHNAPTLQYLDVTAESIVNVSGILQDTAAAADGCYMTYDRLHTLKLKLCSSSSVLGSAVADGVIVFPRLRDLTIIDGYPFGDDTPFRGNAATLESLCITASRDMCSILRRHKIFTLESHPKLRRVSASQPSDGIHSHFDSVEEYMQFMLAIAPGATERQFLGTYSWDGLLPGLGLIKTHAHIQVLALPEIMLDIWDVAAILEWLPVLVELHCQSTLLGSTYQNAIPEDNIARLLVLRDLERVRFRKWRLGCRVSGYLGHVVPVVMKLAVACPNFDFVSLPSHVHNKFLELLEYVIDSGDYEGHEARLRRLVSKSR